MAKVWFAGDEKCPDVGKLRDKWCMCAEQCDEVQFDGGCGVCKPGGTGKWKDVQAHSHCIGCGGVTSIA